MLTKKSPRPTSMAVAFYQALIRGPKSVPVQLRSMVQGSITRNVGLAHEREVNANLSFRTAEKLKREGVL